jgi:hypothetical protein
MTFILIITVFRLHSVITNNYTMFISKNTRVFTYINVKAIGNYQNMPLNRYKCQRLR